jgi:hypothetical protein
MGADLMFSINELKLNREQALANAKKIARGELRQVLTDLEDMAGIGRFSEFDTDNLTDEQREEVEAFLTDCIEVVYDFGKRRDCSFFTVDKDRLFAITAGMSWGDEPTDAYEAFNVCEILGLTEREWVLS